MNPTNEFPGGGPFAAAAALGAEAREGRKHDLEIHDRLAALEARAAVRVPALAVVAAVAVLGGFLIWGGWASWSVIELKTQARACELWRSMKTGEIDGALRRLEAGQTEIRDEIKAMRKDFSALLKDHEDGTAVVVPRIRLPYGNSDKQGDYEYRTAHN